jgi:hypothetical protein
VALSSQKLVAIVNLLSDPGSAANAASILAREAKERGVLVSTLIVQVTSTSPDAYTPPPPPPSAAPSFNDVEPADDDTGPYVKRIGVDIVGLVSEILAETDKAWLALLPSGDEMWLAKSVVDNHGEDPQGRAIFILPRWLARKGNLL